MRRDPSALPPASSLGPAAWLVALLAIAGCDEPAQEDDGGLAPTLSSLQDEVFTSSCALSSCHSTSTLSGQLVLEPGMSHGELLGVTAVQPEAAAEGLVLVQPGDPDASFLWIKLQPGLDARYGALMPSGSTTGLPSEDLDAIRTWIENGAKDD